MREGATEGRWRKVYFPPYARQEYQTRACFDEGRRSEEEDSERRGAVMPRNSADTYSKAISFFPSPRAVCYSVLALRMRSDRLARSLASKVVARGVGCPAGVAGGSDDLVSITGIGWPPLKSLHGKYPVKACRRKVRPDVKRLSEYCVKHSKGLPSVALKLCPV